MANYAIMDDDYARFESLKRHYGTFQSNMLEDLDFYRGDYARNVIPEDWSDDGIEPTVPRTAYDAVENAADHILTTPRIYAPARPIRNDKLKEQLNAAARKAFFESFWHQVWLGGDPLGDAKKKLIHDGRAVVKKSIRWELVPEAPEDKDDKAAMAAWKARYQKAAQGRFVWEVKSLPNDTVYEDLSNPFDPAYVYEGFKIRRDVAARRYPDELVAVGEPLDLIEYVEMWTKPMQSDQGRYKVWIEGVCVHDTVNPYSWETAAHTDDNPDYDGYVPYQIASAGWGMEGSDPTPEERYVGMLRYMHSLLKAEARHLTSVEAQLRLSIFPMLAGKNLPTDNETQPEVGPGKILDLGEDGEFGPIPWPDIPTGAWQFLAKVREDLDRHSRFGALGGSPQRGVDTATEADQNVRNAASRLNGPVLALQRIVTGINRWVLMDIEKVLEAPVTLFGAMPGGPTEITLKPGDIKGFYETHVELTTTDQAALDMRDAKIWADLFNQYPGMDMLEAMGKSGVPNPLESFINRMIQNAVMSPEADMVRKATMLQGMGQYGQMMAERLMAGGQEPNTGGGAQGDAARLTNQEGIENPSEPMETQARERAQVEQAARQYGA